jgi:two-component system, chemotaxis family, response regulator Rcp1
VDAKTIFEPVEILLVEDNPADVRLTVEALRDGKILNRMTVAEDGERALALLRNGEGRGNGFRPDIILLDLNLPRKSGLDVLREIKADESLRRIPVAILTTSKAERDVVRSYELHANCYITKPVDLGQFIDVVKAIGDFWFTIVRLPKKETGGG